MITGFLFTSIIKNRSDESGVNWINIYKSRFFRITPLYALAIIIVSIVAFYKTGFSVNVDIKLLITQYVRWLVFHGSVINDYAETRRILAGVDWTLKYEWLFYFSLPFLYFVIKRGRWVKAASVMCIINTRLQMTNILQFQIT